MKKVISFVLVFVLCLALVPTALCKEEHQWSGTLNLPVEANSSSPDGKIAYFMQSEIIFRSFNYSSFPNGYVHVTGHGANPPSYNLRGGLICKVNGSWVDAGSYQWFSSAIGTHTVLSIKSQYRDNKALPFMFNCRANTNEKVGTYNVSLTASAAWDLGR